MGKICYIIVILMTITIFTAKTQVAPEEGIISVKLASVYSKPDTKSKKLRSLSQNIQVIILKHQGNWYYIEAQGKEGWTQKSNVKLIIRTEVQQEKKLEPALKDVTEEQKKPEQKKIEPQAKEVQSKPPVEKKSYYNQTQHFSPYIFGIKFGINNANIEGNDVPGNAEARMGFCAGGFFIYRIWQGLGLQSEILYNQKGYVQGDSTSKIDYVSLPILLRYALEFGNFHPFINAGMELSYNTNKGLVTPDETYVYDDIKEFDTGLAFGAGIGYNLTGISSLVLDVRYIKGLSTIHDKTIKDVEEMDLKNNVLSITIGYTF